jgi:hypothetical protein
MFMQTITALLFLMVSVHQSQAQAVSDDTVSFGSTPTIGMSAAYSPTSFKAWGTIQNTRQFYFSFDFNHSSLPTANREILFGSGVILTGWIHFPSNGISGSKESRTGFGLVPLSVKIPFSNRRHTPFFTSSAGIIMTDTHFPNQLGSRFNYLLDAGFGYHFKTSETHSLQVGYKLHHLSNGNQRLENPGIDSHMFFIRFMFDL